MDIKETKQRITLGDELTQRGLIFQTSTESIDEILNSNKKRTAYLGVDPTADSIHVGNLITYVLAEHLFRDGHKVVLLVGGATGLIGDPSGKDAERTFSDVEEVAGRTNRITEQLAGISGLSKMEVVNNYDWFSKMNMLEFLRDVGKYFTVNSMMKRESVARRLEGENGISYTEFSYALLQGYDFYHLHTNNNCDLQIGGADQWGNIISGIDFIRKKTGDRVYGVTIPLITEKSSGKKFGKSDGNAIWLDPEKTSYYNFYQFWISVDDDNAIGYLKLFTFISLVGIEEIKIESEANPHDRIAQKRLAYEVTKFVHGADVADDVKKATDIMFKESSISNLSPESIELINKYIPATDTKPKDTVLKIVISGGLASSNREGREFVKNGAIKIDGNTITEDKELSTVGIKGTLFMLSRGKKKKIIVRFTR